MREASLISTSCIFLTMRAHADSIAQNSSKILDNLIHAICTRLSLYSTVVLGEEVANIIVHLLAWTVDSPDLKRIADSVASAIGTVNGQVYSTQWMGSVYMASGTFVDWCDHMIFTFNMRQYVCTYMVVIG